MKDNDAIGTLAKAVAMQAQTAQELAGELTVYASAIHALLRSHPDPGAFAEAFRSTWQGRGAPNQGGRESPSSLRGISRGLGMLESALPDRLHVRPDNVAQPPRD